MFERLFYLVVAALCIGLALSGLRSGLMPLRRVRIDRRRSPVAFALVGLGYAAVAALMLHGAFFR